VFFFMYVRPRLRFAVFRAASKLVKHTTDDRNGQQWPPTIGAAGWWVKNAQCKRQWTAPKQVHPTASLHGGGDANSDEM
jgi:hypothetical protein